MAISHRADRTREDAQRTTAPYYTPQQHHGPARVEPVKDAIDDARARAEEQQPERRRPEHRKQLLAVLADAPLVAPLLARGAVTRTLLEQWMVEHLGER